MPFIKTDIPGLIIFEPKIFNDSRGYFFESYNRETFVAEGIDVEFVQDNQSSSTFGVIRGLHFQRPPHAQTKLIRVLTGAILDVAVDLRTGSPTYGAAYALELSAENKKQLLIPKGFGHGFSVLTDHAEVLYKCDAFYNKESDGGIYFDDADLAIDWQIPADKRIISEKDSALPAFRDFESPFTYLP